MGRESIEREWEPRRINLEVQRVQRAGLPERMYRAHREQRIIHYFCAVNPRVFCCLRKTEPRSYAAQILKDRLARAAGGPAEIERTARPIFTVLLSWCVRDCEYLQRIFYSTIRHSLTLARSCF